MMDARRRAELEKTVQDAGFGYMAPSNQLYAKDVRELLKEIDLLMVSSVKLDELTTRFIEVVRENERLLALPRPPRSDAAMELDEVRSKLSDELIHYSDLRAQYEEQEEEFKKLQAECDELRSKLKSLEGSASSSFGQM